MTRIDELLKETRKAARTCGLSRHALALKAGLSQAALNSMNAPDWNPSVKTLRAVQRVLRKVNGKGKT